jgi:hypothetical protein
VSASDELESSARIWRGYAEAEKMPTFSRGDARHWAEQFERAAARLREVDEAIAAKGGTIHSPTQDAYDAACRAIEKHRDRADAAEAKVAELERWRSAAFVAHSNLDLDIDASPEARAILTETDDG